MLHEFFATLEAKRQQVQTNIAALEYEKNNTIHKNALASIEQKLQTLKDFLAQINWK